MKNKTLTILTLSLCFCKVAFAQMSSIIRELPKLPNQENQLVKPLSIPEKKAMLALVEGDSVQFIRDYREDEKHNYYPLNMEGLHFLDLDSDGDLDLLYSGQNYTQIVFHDTKLYFNEGNKLVLQKTIDGGAVSFRQRKNGTKVVAMRWIPCCTSYTSRLTTLTFSGHHQFTESSISVIGGIGITDFSGLKEFMLDSIALYAFGLDFKGAHPYFGKRDKEIQPLLRAMQQPILLLSMKGQTTVGLITEREINGEIWSLIITDPLDDVPRSLYEWSRGDNRRFVGWVRSRQLRKKK